MQANDTIDDEGAHVGGLVASSLELVQRLAAHGETVTVGFVPLRHTRIKVPAVVIEPSCLGNGTNIINRRPFQLEKANHDIGDIRQAAYESGAAYYFLLATAHDITAAGAGIVAFQGMEHILERDAVRDRARGCRL